MPNAGCYRISGWLPARASLPGDLADRSGAGHRSAAHAGGPEPPPALLHGDAQQHNFVSTPAGAVLIDPAPYFGHPELDLALLGYFHPVPRHVLDGYTEIRPVDAGFAERRELWRLFRLPGRAVAVAGGTPLGAPVPARLGHVIASYR